MPRIILTLLTICLLLIVAVANRHWLLVQIMSLAPVELTVSKQDEGPNAIWYDDYYTIEWLDDRTVAIGEPLYYQQNINYLILGDERAILFDAGAGFRRIEPVVDSLTDKPLTFVPSHFHYDHLGNDLPFEQIAVADLPHVSERTIDGSLTLKWHEHLGAAEGYETPTFTVSEWLKPGDTINLGNRTLQVVYTPGHTNDSISLYDPEADFLFSGDFIYQGDLFAFLPNSSLAEYAQGSDNVLLSITEQTKIFAAHRLSAPGTPVLKMSDVTALKDTLSKIEEGTLEATGFYPVSYPISESSNLIAEPPLLQNWDITYPDLSLSAPTRE